LELKSRLRVESVLSVSFSATPESTHAGLSIGTFYSAALGLFVC